MGGVGALVLLLFVFFMYSLPLLILIALPNDGLIVTLLVTTIGMMYIYSNFAGHIDYPKKVNTFIIAYGPGVLLKYCAVQLQAEGKTKKARLVTCGAFVGPLVVALQLLL